jgi:hypothetical protein
MEPGRWQIMNKQIISFTADNVVPPLISTLKGIDSACDRFGGQMEEMK